MPGHALGLIGSPRPESLSTALLHTVLETLKQAGWSAETFDTTSENIHHCTGCGTCAESGCCIRHDALDPVFGALQTTNAVVIASPIYFYSVTAQLKRFIDRSQPFWHRRTGLKDTVALTRAARPCLLIATAGGPPSPRLFVGAELTVRVWCNTLGLAYTKPLLIPETDNLSDAQRSDLCTQARDRAGVFLDT